MHIPRPQEPILLIRPTGLQQLAVILNWLTTLEIETFKMFALCATQSVEGWMSDQVTSFNGRTTGLLVHRGYFAKSQNVI